MPHDAALEALTDARILILPSRWEALSLVVLEAMAMGVAVVASAVGGVPEAITDGDSGLLVEQADPEAFAVAVRRLLDDSGLRRRIAANARQAVQRFSWSSTRQAYFDLYRTYGRAD